MSICRYDPLAPGVNELAARVEARMWELAKTAGDTDGFISRSMKRLRSLAGRRVTDEGLDFPNWREELQRWLGAALDGISLTQGGPAVRCRSFPENSEALVERFPYMFRLETEVPWRGSAGRRKLADRLMHADERRSSKARAFVTDPQGWLTSGAGAAGAAAGLTIADVAHWADRGVIAGVGGVVGVIAGLFVARQHNRPSHEQQVLRAHARQWVDTYLSVRGQCAFDEVPLVLVKLQAAIERESARRHGRSLIDRLSGIPGQKIRDDLTALRERLRWKLIPEADAANDRHVYATLRRLDAALDQAAEAPDEEDSVLPTLHILMVALDVAPPVPPEDPKGS